MANPQQAKNIGKYLSELARSHEPLSEGHLYSLIGEHLVKGLWGYSAGEYEITPLKKLRPKEPGVPDLRLKSKAGVW